MAYWRGSSLSLTSMHIAHHLVGLLLIMSRACDSSQSSDPVSRELFRCERWEREAGGLMSCNHNTRSDARSYNSFGSTVQKDAILRPRQKSPAHHVPNAYGRRGGSGGCVRGWPQLDCGLMPGRHPTEVVSWYGYHMQAILRLMMW